jgi:prevent-host-death family protein
MLPCLRYVVSQLHAEEIDITETERFDDPGSGSGGPGCTFNSTVQIIEMKSFPLRTAKNDSIVVSALRARANFGELLRRVENERRSLVIEKRGAPKAVLLSIRDYVRMAAPEPEVLRVIGDESRRKGTDTLSSRQIDQAIKATRAQKSKRG